MNWSSLSPGRAKIAITGVATHPLANPFITSRIENFPIKFWAKTLKARTRATLTGGFSRAHVEEALVINTITLKTDRIAMRTRGRPYPNTGTLQTKFSFSPVLAKKDNFKRNDDCELGIVESVT
jgi:hypothetical protein